MRHRLTLGLACACLAAAAHAGDPPAEGGTGLPPVPVYVDDTATAGITASYEGAWEFMVGGGVATFDCGGDGFPDMLIAGGAAPATFWRNQSVAGGPLSFAAEASGLELGMVTGAYPLDVDADGITDIVLLRIGENVVMRGLGDCRFERANEDWGFDGADGWSTALAATWEGGATWPSIAIGNYIDRTEDAFPWGSCTDNLLHRPRDGGGAFAPALPLTPSHCALSMLFTDWDRSGRPALRVSNDREYYKGGEEQLWDIAPGEPPRLFTPQDGWQRLRIWGMGIAARDLDDDGYPEYFLTSMADNKLQSLSLPADGAEILPIYDDIAFARGVTAHRPHTGGDIRPSTAWHAQFEDVNNDGLADLFVVKGNVAKMPDFAQDDPNNLLLQGKDGRFAEAAAHAGVADMGIGRGGALVDLNLDGWLDMVVVNRWDNARVLRNTGPADIAGQDAPRQVGGAEAGVEAGAGWVQLRPTQPGPNRDAIGGWIEVRLDDRVKRREITVGGGHAGGGLGWLHFGLGAANMAEARVIWPDGVTGPWHSLAPGGFAILERDRPARPWTP